MPHETSAVLPAGQRWRLGPDAFFDFTESMVHSSATSDCDSNTRAGVCSSSDHLRTLAESCNRGALRHLQSLRRTFGLLHGNRDIASAAVATGLGGSGHTMSLSPIGRTSSVQSPQKQPPQTSVCSDDAIFQSDCATNEMRQRRLLADMYVSQWKRMHERFQSEWGRMISERADRQQSTDEGSARRAQQNHDAFKNGLAMLRNGGRV